MAVCYDKLFHLMIDRKMSNAQRKEQAGFSASIITLVPPELLRQAFLHNEMNLDAAVSILTDLK